MIKFRLKIALVFSICLIALTTISNQAFAAWQIYLTPGSPNGEPVYDQKALDVYAAEFWQGATIDSCNPNDTDAQNWQYTIDTELSNAVGFSIFSLSPTANTSLCLSAISSSTIQLENCNGQEYQLWFYSEIGNSNLILFENSTHGYNKNGQPYVTGSCLDVHGDSTQSGALIDLAVCNNTNAQIVYTPLDGCPYDCFGPDNMSYWY